MSIMNQICDNCMYAEWHECEKCFLQKIFCHCRLDKEADIDFKDGTCKHKHGMNKTYKHYKGKEYRVIGVAKNSESLEELVVYETLYNNPKSKLWVRPKEMFCQEVEVDGKKVPRFKYLG